MPVDNEQIKIFDADDKSLKILGELLSNDTSRKILKSLIEKEMYTNQIASALDIRVSLVIHHLNKMKEIGIVETNHKKISRKGNDHKHYRVIPGLFVMPNETKEEIQQKDTLKKIFRESIKLGGLVIISSIIFFISGGSSKSEIHDIINAKIPDPTQISPLIIPLLIMIFGLLFFYFSKGKRKRQ